ncbi:hypothetical protein SCHPADRAFT_214741 [Schizopora paradoxa]|uniref:Uncharacterized protein n=1 Tax=Schizopora paradoxa TaxID=27342 RepID=A0A0H2S449_9AGAM|nr:hypothetical protein SCHPADRAFT_214741 [Schizopora paradoxa]
MVTSRRCRGRCSRCCRRRETRRVCLLSTIITTLSLCSLLRPPDGRTRPIRCLQVMAISVLEVVRLGKRTPMDAFDGNEIEGEVIRNGLAH